MTALWVFLTSLSLIALLFAIKYVEVHSGHVLAPALRARADRGARILKALIWWASIRAAQFPPTAVLVMRYGIHQAALYAARLLRRLEAAAYDLADYVSHKHHFERRETQSQFLKQVGELKNNSTDAPADRTSA